MAFSPFSLSLCPFSCQNIFIVFHFPLTPLLSFLLPIPSSYHAFLFSSCFCVPLCVPSSNTLALFSSPYPFLFPCLPLLSMFLCSSVFLYPTYNTSYTTPSTSTYPFKPSLKSSDYSFLLSFLPSLPSSFQGFKTFSVLIFVLQTLLTVK